MNIKSLVSALAALAALGLQSATSYMATEQYVQNVVKAESNRTDIAIGELRKEVQDAKYLTPSAIKAGDNVSVTTNEAGEVTIAVADSFPADYAAVSNAAMTALQNAKEYTDEVTDDIPRITESEENSGWAADADWAAFADGAGFAELANHAYTSGGFFDPDTGFWRSDDEILSQLDAATETNALQDAAIAGKQDKLPYPTNAIPYAAISGKPSLATVATSGSYNDLSNKPTIPTVPTAQINAATATNALQDVAISTLNDTKVDKSDLDPLLFAQYYPEGNVKSTTEFTLGIKYDAPDTINRTITVKPFCFTGVSENDNSNLSGRVVIPPFVDDNGNGYITDDGTRFKVVGVSGGSPNLSDSNLTAVIAPSTVTTVGNSAFCYCTSLSSVSFPTATTVRNYAFDSCTALTSISIPAATNIGESAFNNCTALASVSLPAATSIGGSVFVGCTALTSVSLPVATIGDNAFRECFKLTSVSLAATTSIGGSAFRSCATLTFVDFGDTPRPSVPTLGIDAFRGVPESCRIIVPDAQYDAWIAADGWRSLVTRGYKFLRHSAWEYARKYETFTIKVEDNVLIFSPQE